MRNIVIVDYPLLAEGISLILNKHISDTFTTITSTIDPSNVAPDQALVLIELYLPDNLCGLTLAKQLHQSRPDCIPLVWTLDPAPLYIWLALENKLPGFLDKSISPKDLHYWLTHAQTKGGAWPTKMLNLAHEWHWKQAVQLRSLTPDLWLLWAELLSEKTIADLTTQLRWSRRTIERRLSELYTVLDVHSRAEAIHIAWQWKLVGRQSTDSNSSASLLGLTSMTNGILALASNSK
jgi:two-component system, NarL family, competent response regulator ComA